MELGLPPPPLAAPRGGGRIWKNMKKPNMGKGKSTSLYTPLYTHQISLFLGIKIQKLLLKYGRTRSYKC